MPGSVAELVRAGRARELRGIGASIAGKLEELVANGEIAELRDLEAETMPELVGYGRLLGLSAKRMVAFARALDVLTAADFKDAVAGGRLRDVSGIGPVMESKIRAAVEREPQASRGLTLERALSLSNAIAGSLGGELAGPPRRSCELSHELAVVCASDDAGAVFGRFESLPSIVAVLERGERHVLALTLEGVPVTLVVAPPSAFGTELVRATGSAEYVGRSGRCPTPATSRHCSGGSGSSTALPSFASVQVRSRRPISSHARPSEAISTATRRGPTAGRASTTWRSRHRPVGTSTSRSAITHQTCASCRA